MDYLKLAKDAFEKSTSYLDTNYRKAWEDNLRMFQSKHPKDSKYLSESYKHRSKIFRPKTRSVIRKNEAAVATAFFSNTDVLSVDPVNYQSREQIAGAELMKEVVNYRLTKTVPWFMILIGGFQDAQVSGVVASYQYWKYKVRKTKQMTPLVDPMTGQPMMGLDGNPLEREVEKVEILEDKPCIELLPIENIRIDPSADWLDPIGTSPYVIRLVPMYVTDILDMMDNEDDKTHQPKWRKYTEEEIKEIKNSYDSTRVIREKDRQDSDEPDNKPLGAYEIVWVHENFMKTRDGEVVYFTLGTEKMLSDPKPVEEVYYHGNPVTLGCAIIETHRPMPSALTELGGELQKEANEIVNQRLDNVKLALNKRFIAKRGAQVDLQSLVRNVPGSVTLATDPITDVREVEFNDVTASSYQEQDRLDVAFDELMGNFSSGSVLTNRKLNETVGGMNIMNSGASQLTEYLIRTFTETWVEPVLRKLVKMEAEYETDEIILAIAADRADLFQKYGVSKVTDSLLNQDLTLTVNVGMGATDPKQKLASLIAASKTYAEIRQMLPDANMEEFKKEIFGLAGHKDGIRFFQGQGQDPRMQQAKQMIQQLQQQLQQAQLQLKSKQDEIALEQKKMSDGFSIESQKAQNSAQLEMDKLFLERKVKEAELALKKYEIELKNKAVVNKNNVDAAIKLKSQSQEAQDNAQMQENDQMNKEMVALINALVEMQRKSQDSNEKLINTIASSHNEMVKVMSRPRKGRIIRGEGGTQVVSELA